MAAFSWQMTNFLNQLADSFYQLYRARSVLVYSVILSQGLLYCLMCLYVQVLKVISYPLD
jgi:hypothetical protein